MYEYMSTWCLWMSEEGFGFPGIGVIVMSHLVHTETQLWYSSNEQQF